MKNFTPLRICFLLSLVFSSLSIWAQPSSSISKNDTIRILAIGNSFSQDAIEQYLYNLAESDGLCVVIGNLYYGGCSLQQHFDFLQENKPAYAYRKIMNGVKVDTPKTTLNEALEDEQWDYISFQQASHYSGQPETYSPFLTDLMGYVRKHSPEKTKYAFHMTWAYATDSNHGGLKNYNNSQKEMYEAILNATKNALQIEKFDLLIPCGTAIQNARTSQIGDNLCRDGYHLDYIYGRYTAACTWFEAIFNKPVVGNKFAPIGISEYQKTVAQKAAHAAMENPYSVTKID